MRVNYFESNILLKNIEDVCLLCDERIQLGEKRKKIVALKKVK